MVIEAIFDWPGLGLLTYQAIDNQDYPVIQGVFLLSSALVIAFNLAADSVVRLHRSPGSDGLT